jgi:hypothetical protein
LSVLIFWDGEHTYYFFAKERKKVKKYWVLRKKEKKEMSARGKMRRRWGGVKEFF